MFLKCCIAGATVLPCHQWMVTVMFHHTFSFIRGCILNIMSHRRSNINSKSEVNSARLVLVCVCVLCLGQGFKSQPACVQDVEQQYRNVIAFAVHAMKVYMGVDVWLHLFLTALDGVEWSTSCFSCLTRGIEAKYPLNRRLLGSRASLDALARL